MVAVDVGPARPSVAPLAALHISVTTAMSHSVFGKKHPDTRARNSGHRRQMMATERGMAGIAKHYYFQCSPLQCRDYDKTKIFKRFTKW